MEICTYQTNDKARVPVMESAESSGTILHVFNITHHTIVTTRGTFQDFMVPLHDTI